MRLISQDGEVDVSYENVLLAISDGGLAVVIKAYNYISYNDFMCMGIYETVEKAKAGRVCSPRLFPLHSS